jgi:thiamine-phosphate pyrophosphorylase
VREVDAQGVHLGRSDAEVNAARTILGSSAIIGGTAHTANEYEILQSSEVDYIGLGPYRMTTTKKDLSPLLGFQGVKDIVHPHEKLKPVFVVGGVLETDIADLHAIGVYGVAISSALSRASNISETATNLVSVCSRGVNYAEV